MAMLTVLIVSPARGTTTSIRKRWFTPSYATRPVVAVVRFILSDRAAQPASR